MFFSDLNSKYALFGCSNPKNIIDGIISNKFLYTFNHETVYNNII